MGMVIVSGRNSGYPFAEGLPDTPPLADTAPYHEYYMRISPVRNGGYPAIVQTPSVGGTGLSEPYPDFMFHCLGSGFNDGYPLILQLHGIAREHFCDIFFAEDNAQELFFGSQKVTAAYCNGQKVFGIRYVTQQ
ncbi:MAG: hypothetical protein IKO47_07965 [Ruminococcus sp.]|nr:hypothetical protein [Ruminococcus sp.]